MSDQVRPRGMTRLAMAALACIAVVLVAASAQAAERTIVLGFVCASQESARQVALRRGWEQPGTLPRDCRSLLGRGGEDRLARLSRIVEILPLEDGSWIEVGEVRRSTVEAGYSAGVTRQLLLF